MYHISLSCILLKKWFEIFKKMCNEEYLFSDCLTISVFIFEKMRILQKLVKEIFSESICDKEKF